MCEGGWFACGLCMWVWRGVEGCWCVWGGGVVNSCAGMCGAVPSSEWAAGGSWWRPSWWCNKEAQAVWGSVGCSTELCGEV